MAASGDSGDSVGSWPGFVAQVNTTFNLLRDFFGYALPGGVFFAIGLLSGRYSMRSVENLLAPYHPPTWAFVVVAVGACYILGDILAALAYLPTAVAKWSVWEGSRIRYGIVKPWVQGWSDGRPRRILAWIDGKLVAWLKPWLEENPTEISPALVVARSRHPKLLDTLDRRETLTILAGSTSMALLGGWFVFFWARWDVGKILCWAGVLVLLQFLTGITHLRRVRYAILQADQTLKEEDKSKSTPDFNQSIAEIAKAVDGLAKAVKAAASGS